MPNNPNKKTYNANYAKAKLKRIPLDVQKEKYNQIKAAADAVGEKVNSYIKIIRAINETIDRDNQKQANTNHFPITDLPPQTESQIDLTRLLSDFLYQIDISAAYGNEVLASLLDKARKQQAAETK